MAGCKIMFDFYRKWKLRRKAPELAKIIDIAEMIFKENEK